MSVSTLIDQIVPYVPDGYSRSTGNISIIKLIQNAIDLLFATDSTYCLWYGTDNDGWPPYLKTTAGTEKYEIVAANLSCDSITMPNDSNYTVRAAKVKEVFVDATNIDYAKRFVGTPYLYTFANPYTTMTTRIEVARVPVRSIPATEAQSAYVLFPEDPGTTTDKYFCTFTWEHPRLTSESIPLGIPKIFEDAIEDYVIGKIQTRENGVQGDRLTNFYRYWLPRFSQETSLGAQLKGNQTYPRTC